MKNIHRIAVISDTHGLLRPEVFRVFTDVELIIHAGDVGRKSVLEKLSRLHPCKAVRGNIDSGELAATLPLLESLSIEGKRIVVVHDLAEANQKSTAPDIVICGHSHVPKIEYKGSVLCFNPGSAGPKRFSLPTCVGILTIQKDTTQACLIEL